MMETSTSAEIPLPNKLKKLGELFNNIGFAHSCRNIRMCYGLELVATAIKDGDLARGKELMISVRRMLIRDIGASPDACGKHLDQAIATRINTNTEKDPIFNEGLTLIEHIAYMNPHHVRKTLRGRINLLGALTHLHEAMYHAALAEKSIETSTIPLESELIKAYKALKPATKNHSARHTFKDMVSLGS